MKKQKKFKKDRIKWPLFLERAGEKVFRKMITALVAALFLIAAYFLTSAFVHGSDYFNLKQVEVRGLADQTSALSLAGDLLKAHKYKNIFKVNLKGIEVFLGSKYPDAKGIFVKRCLPDKIAVSFSFRSPVALVGGARTYPVDDEGFLIFSADAKSLVNLPVITGVDIRESDKVIRRNESRNLKTALGLLKEIRNSKFMTRYPVTKISAGDIKDMSFYIKDSLEIRIGCENWKDRLKVLYKTLRDPRIALDRVRYIDLRFADVAIGPK